MYDFANSGYTTVVITAVFSAYFVGEVAGNAPWATLAWTAALAVSYALVILTAPVIGIRLFAPSPPGLTGRDVIGHEPSSRWVSIRKACPRAMTSSSGLIPA